MNRLLRYIHKKANVDVALRIAMDTPGVAVFNHDKEASEVYLVFDSTETQRLYSTKYTEAISKQLTAVPLEHQPAHPGPHIPTNRYVHSPCDRMIAKSAAQSTGATITEEKEGSITLAFVKKQDYWRYIKEYLRLSKKVHEALKGG